jgi:hypothetical protein
LWRPTSRPAHPEKRKQDDLIDAALRDLGLVGIEGLVASGAGLGGSVTNCMRTVMSPVGWGSVDTWWYCSTPIVE